MSGRRIIILTLEKEPDKPPDPGLCAGSGYLPANIYELSLFTFNSLQESAISQMCISPNGKSLFHFSFPFGGVQNNLSGFQTCTEVQTWSN